MFLLSVLLLFASWVCLEVAVVALRPWGIALNVALHIGFVVLWSGLMVGIHRMALQVVDGQIPAISDLTAFLRRGPSFLLAASLYLVAVLGGLLLLVLPGAYVAVRYALFGHAIATGEASAVDALRDAGVLCEGRWWSLWFFMFLVLAINLVGAALLGLGLLISFPVSLLATASLFRTLQRTGAAPLRR